VRRIERHFPSLERAGVTDIVGALAFRAIERPDAEAYVLLENGEHPAPALTYGALLASSRRVAHGLRARLPARSRVLIAFPAGGDSVVALFGCFLADMIAVPAQPPRGGRGAARLEALARDCTAAALLTTSGVRDGWRADAGPPALAFEDCDTGAEIALAAPNPDAVAFLQYTSGSTGAPKGVVITHRALWHNQSVIRTCFDHAEGVTLVGWLPNFHDMGLIGNLLQPLYAGGASVILPPAAFTQKPLRWLRAISRYRAHTSGAPNFAYDLCVRAATDAACDGLDLSAWRVAFNGAEPVRASTLREFAKTFAPYGFHPEAFMSCYGLAESTLMVTGTRIGAPPSVMRASRAKLATGALTVATTPGDAVDVVSCGDEVAGAAVIVADVENGAPLADGAVGEVLVRSPSTSVGYWENIAATRAALIVRDGADWLRTGDLGARVDGDLFIVGRCKDLLILNGRKVHPADVEAAVEATFGARGAQRALVTAMAGDLSEEAALFLELSRDALRGLALEPMFAALRRCAAAAADTPLAAIVLLKPGALPLTSSGKLRRAACAARFLAGRLSGVAHLDAAAARWLAGARTPAP